MVFRNLKKEIREWLKEEGFEKETVIQEKVMDFVETGKDVLITAPTGHGKTLAAMLPLFNRYSGEKERGIKILYICPLKALNRDILRRISDLGSRIWMEVDIRHGDTKQSVRTLQTKIPPDVLITTPETLQAILVGKRMREHLKKLKAVVVDEIHEMVSNKRGAQLSLGIERLRLLSKDFQLIGLSATVGNKEVVSKFLSEKCIVLEDKGMKEYDVSVEKYKPDEKDAAFSEQIFVGPKTGQAIRKISEILDKNRSTIIFTNTRESAELLGTKMKLLRDDVEVHHSSLSKEIRISAEERMKLGELKGIIATSSLELGIDIGHVDFIVQFMSPRQVTKLVQRIGRSGHRVGKVSRGVIITATKDDYTEAKAIINLMKKGWLENSEVIEKPLDVLAHQIVGFCMDSQEVNPDSLFSRIRDSYVFRTLERKEFDDVLDLMYRIGIIGFAKGNLYRTRQGLHYYFSNLSVIPDEKNYLVINDEDRSRIGVLHQGFVVQHIATGARFIMNGRVWHVTELKGNMIHVVRTKSETGAIPSWEGELIPVPCEVAEEFASIRKTGKKVFIEQSGDIVAIYTWFGSKANTALGEALAALMSQDIGTSVGVKTDPYTIILKGPGIKKEKIRSHMASSDWIDGVLRSSLPNSSLFAYRFWHVARRFGIIKKDAELNKHRISKLIQIFRNSPVVEETFREIFFDRMDTKALKKLLERKVEFRGWSKETEKKVTNIPGYVKVSDGKELLEKVWDRLRSKRFFFQCTNCWEKQGSFGLDNLPKKCSNCGSELLGFVPSHQKDNTTKSSLRKTAPLYLYYKRDACFVMGGFGIGPQTAIRILSIPYKNEEELVKRIVDSERQFLRTRRFWD
jgi:ATP-dependent Lhr-like helicase